MNANRQSDSCDIAQHDNGHCPAELIDLVESSFVRIQQTRMHDVPILNHALEVQAVGFRLWQNCYLGVLITPWFMNLMMLPGESEDWSMLVPGKTVTHTFPSGSYEFIIGDEELIGRYQMCSLFSPVFEFQDHQSAVATAEEVMIALMDENNHDATSTREKEMQRIWTGKLQEGDGTDATELGMMPDQQAETSGTADGSSLRERINQPMSRRDLLRGRFLSDR